MAVGDRTVVLDWATLGLAPAGSDLAHLALGTLQDHTAAYLDGAAQIDEILFGYRATLVLVGASRVHWMLSAGVEVPAGYVDFLSDNAP